MLGVARARTETWPLPAGAHMGSARMCGWPCAQWGCVRSGKTWELDEVATACVLPSPVCAGMGGGLRAGRQGMSWSM